MTLFEFAGVVYPHRKRIYISFIYTTMKKYCLGMHLEGAPLKGEKQQQYKARFKIAGTALHGHQFHVKEEAMTPTYQTRGPRKDRCTTLRLGMSDGGEII